MNRTKYLQFHQQCCELMHDICQRKSADYASNSNALSNFELGAQLNIGTTEQGLLFRMCDKLSRIANLVSTGQAQVRDESTQDALLDLANYCISLAAVLETKEVKNNVQSIMADGTVKYDFD